MSIAGTAAKNRKKWASQGKTEENETGERKRKREKSFALVCSISKLQRLNIRLFACVKAYRIEKHSSEFHIKAMQ